jgi:hypothetical protein
MTTRTPAHRISISLSPWFAVIALAAASGALLAVQGVTSAGIEWTIPTGWTEQPARAMRVATYTVPGKGADAGECGVFYFGKGQGGTAQENIKRWGSQFEGAPEPKTSVSTVAGMTVHWVKASGTYLAPAGPVHLKNTRPSGASTIAPISR